jgi:hypothetical protein
LTGVKLVEAPDLPPDEPPEDGGAAVALVAVVVDVLVDVVFLVEVVEGVVLVVAAAVWVEDAARTALLEEEDFLHDLRPNEARGTSGTLTG